ncbi:MAG: hypothetical protein Q7T10_04605 [Rhodoferax sp.]|uniref:hypothetical protein n=1 Tax=Rhodoferax sp. TaxID=50421 RepID=UPI0027265FFB|nr:hypothetical protein [Rhodoferax sp.]MDO8448066.1 hypothetical protein [Rhodoferax sp.]
MRFSIDVHDTEVAGLLSGLVKITGIEPWKRRFEWLHRELNENHFMEDWLRERCLIEWTMNDILRDPSLMLQRPFRIENIAQYELVGFAAGTVRSHERLSEDGKRRLRGALLDGLKEDKGLLSIQHEITTAIHLMSRGFDVEFRDMECGGGFDYIARKGDVEIEVECKMFSADLGRKIHRRRSATLCKALEGALTQTYNTASVGLIVTVSLPDRLTPSPGQHRGIEEAVRTGLLSGNVFTQTEYCDVQVSDFPIDSSPFNKAPEQLSRKEIDQFVWERTGRSNSTLISMFSPKRRAVVLLLESEKPDDVLKGMRHQLREAAKGQFSKTRPAFLAVQLHDLTADQLGDLAQSDSSWRGNATGLQIMTSDFLQSPSRAHIHTVVYRSHGHLTDQNQDGTKRGDGLAYMIKNGFHPLYKDSRFAAFGDQPIVVRA